MNIAEYLKNRVLFTPEELKDILSYFQKEIIQKNETILKEGQVCHRLYFLEKGVGRSYHINSNGKYVTQWFFGEGSFMTSLESYFQESPSLSYLEILETSTVYSITKENIDLLFDKYHKMEKFGRIISTEMTTKISNKLNAIQFQTASDRYKYMLKEFPNISNRVSLGDIASYLGITQETLSRIRKK
jgi:CRP-like cAMP-binding protein